MTAGPVTDFLRHLRSTAAARANEDCPDAGLLQQFVTEQAEAAFQTLVQRHGPMVLRVCGELLRDPHDVEDAFQATFLVLVSRASSIRDASLLGNWLYGVAYRVAVRARANSARRRTYEARRIDMVAAKPAAPGLEPEQRIILHEELNRLPEKYRVPVVLCYLQGKTNEEAARQLAWPIGTVKGRLTRARDLLRGRLTRRGLALSASTFALILSQNTASAAVPVALLSSTTKAALLVAAGQAAANGVVSAQAAALSKGVIQTMFLTKLNVTIAVLLGASVIGAGGGLFAFHLPAGDARVAARAAVKLAPRVAADGAKQEDETPDALRAARLTSANKMKQLMLAMHNFHSVNRLFPAAAVYDKKGKALLSWRVLLLPYLEEGDLFKEFHLDEPWDSAHNKTLLAKMPKVYAPVRGPSKGKNVTFYQVFKGKGAAFEGVEGIGYAEFTDGTSNTIAIIEAGEAVPWTKPADLAYDANKPLPKLGGLFKEGINAAFADGSVHWLKKDFDEPTMRAVITRNGGEIVDPDKLRNDK